MELVAKSQIDATITREIQDYSMQPIKVDAALRLPSLPRGIGINFRGRQLEFIGDAWNHDDKYEEMKTMLVQTYQVLAAQEALRSLGYTVSHPQVLGGTRTMRVAAVRA